jgi:putative glutamine amidotransferase
MKNYSQLAFIIGFFLLFTFCQQQEPDRVLRIAISKATPNTSYENYIKWLKNIDSTVIIEEMYHLNLDSAKMVFDQCDGLLLTGGTDIYPGLYGKEADTARCWEPDFKRDSLELMLIGLAIEKQVPILGICRGHQMLNTYFGGSLIIDIPEDFDTLVKHRIDDGYDCYHMVGIEEGSLLLEISGQETGRVNSAHHQGVDQLAENLVPVALSEDGLIEAIAYKNRENKPFLLGVQWHPERLDLDNPLSGKIGKYFIEQVRQEKTPIHHE